MSSKEHTVRLYIPNPHFTKDSGLNTGRCSTNWRKRMFALSSCHRPCQRFSRPGSTVSFCFQCIQLADDTKVSDLASLSSSQSDDDTARLAVKHTKHIKTFQHAIGAPARCPFPVIAAIHGAVLGLGVDIVCACDVRYAASNATFSIKVHC